MSEELNSQISIAEPFGRQKIGNLTIIDAEFWGSPNFTGVEDNFKDARPKFSVRIPNDMADELREIGWNVKTVIPTEEDLKEGREPRSGLKVMVGYESDPDIWLIMGDTREKLTKTTAGLIDKSRITEMSMEIRGWEYDPEEKPGEYSARLVQLVVVIVPNLIQNRYGVL